ncbi:MAG: hypothetical protein GXY87_06685 [Tissierellia bacterium]|nr:hypothetical protein [Tissierellia bacterium]
MEVDVIRELISLDREAQKRVEQAHEMKVNLIKKIAEDKNKISKEAWEEVKREVDIRKKELDQEIQNEAQENMNSFKEVSSKIETIFNENKEAWLDELFSRCIE